MAVKIVYFLRSDAANFVFCAMWRIYFYCFQVTHVIKRDSLGIRAFVAVELDLGLGACVLVLHGSV